MNKKFTEQDLQNFEKLATDNEPVGIDGVNYGVDPTYFGVPPMDPAYFGKSTMQELIDSNEYKTALAEVQQQQKDEKKTKPNINRSIPVNAPVLEHNKNPETEYN